MTEWLRLDPSGAFVPAAEAGGIAVRRGRPARADVDGREVWLTSALHGIRPVTRWAGPGAPPAGPAERALAWQARLEALTVPVAARR